MPTAGETAFSKRGGIGAGCGGCSAGAATSAEDAIGGRCGSGGEEFTGDGRVVSGSVGDGNAFLVPRDATFRDPSVAERSSIGAALPRFARLKSDVSKPSRTGALARDEICARGGSTGAGARCSAICPPFGLDASVAAATTRGAEVEDGAAFGATGAAAMAVLGATGAAAIAAFGAPGVPAIAEFGVTGAAPIPALGATGAAAIATLSARLVTAADSRATWPVRLVFAAESRAATWSVRLVFEVDSPAATWSVRLVLAAEPRPIARLCEAILSLAVGLAGDARFEALATCW